MNSNTGTFAINVNKTMSWNPITLVTQVQEWGDPKNTRLPSSHEPHDRPPFEITNLIRFYNLAMVVLNAKFCYIVLYETYLPTGRYSIWCQGITGYMDERLEEQYRNGWWYIAVRYADLLDTVFFVLRKKFNQITHLHVIHHTIVAVNCWFWVLYAPEGQPALGLAINAFVHVVMYTYYFLATLGPSVQKYLWWKKYLTTMQIVQFVIFLVHMSIPLFVDCGFPRHLIHVANAQTVLVLTLRRRKYDGVASGGARTETSVNSSNGKKSQ
ncbi:hypothetical protein MRX96_012953 [Rhipicephalus microplus]